MHLQNCEGITEYYIDENWHKDRKRGLAAMMRVKDEEEFIGSCLLSIKDIFDEIVIALNNCADSTAAIIQGLNLENVIVLEYPWKLHHNGPGHNSIPENSICDNSYYYNWVLSKTQYSHVCKWDGDNVALPFLNQKLKRKILRNNVSYEMGINLAGESFSHLSKHLPYTGKEPHYFKVSQDTYYQQGKLTQYLHHRYETGLFYIEKPTFLHFKNVKSITSASQIWPENWKEIDLFQSIYKRRETGGGYYGCYPEALKEKIVMRAIEYACRVDELKSQGQVMETIGDLLFEIRDRHMQGSLVEIGSLKGKTTVFLARIAETLFPMHNIITVDPYTGAGMEKSSRLKSTSEVYEIYEYFKKATGDLKNHIHLKMTSREVADRLPNDIIFTFIDGEHTFNAVIDDFKLIYERTVKNGIIAIDDYKNSAWPEVGEAFHYIRKKYRFKVKLLKTDIKAAFFVKKR